MKQVRLSELIGKDIVNIHNGARLGTVADSDLEVDANTGEIAAIILPSKGSILNIWDKSNMTIPWEAVRKIGSEVIIVELDDTHTRYKRYSY